MKVQVLRIFGKASVRFCMAVALTFCAFAWITKAYFSVRLELTETRGVLADMVYGSWLIGKNLEEGNIEKAVAFSATNQLKGMQYAVRRDVKDANVHQATCICFRNGNLILTDEQRDFFTQYNSRYRSWSCSGWIDSNTPFMDQVVDILYYHWPDSRPRWTTWMPRDYATNIKVGSPEENPETHKNIQQDNTTIEKRLEMAIEQFRNEQAD